MCFFRPLFLVFLVVVGLHLFGVHDFIHAQTGNYQTGPQGNPPPGGPGLNPNAPGLPPGHPGAPPPDGAYDRYGDDWHGPWGHRGRHFPFFPLVIFGAIIVLVAIKHHHRNKALHAKLEAIKILAEKGQPVPPEMLQSLDHHHHGFHHRGGRNPAYRMVVHLALGLGFLIYFLVRDPQGGLWAIGVGFLVLSAGQYFLSKPK